MTRGPVPEWAPNEIISGARGRPTPALAQASATEGARKLAGKKKKKMVSFSLTGNKY